MNVLNLIPDIVSSGGVLLGGIYLADAPQGAKLEPKAEQDERKH